MEIRVIVKIDRRKPFEKNYYFFERKEFKAGGIK